MSVKATSLSFSVKGPRWPEPRSFTLGAQDLATGGGWIGRAADCAIALDDPDRFVSLRHARLDFANGGFWLTDHSTNGTFLNGESTPLAKGERRPLAAGDTIRVGLFDIAVMAGGLDSSYAGLASPLDTASPLVPVVARDPLAEFARSGNPAAPAERMVPPTVQVGDPFDTLLADLGRPSGVTPLPRFSDSVPPADADPAGAQPAPAPVPPAAQPTLEAEPRPASAVPQADMLSAIATEVADLLPALRPQPDAGPRPPSQPMDTATAALAAFWCGLGIIPRALRPEDLVDVMTELGVAFREASDGLAAMLGAMHGASGRAGLDGGNPLAGGHSGLRRHLDGRQAAAMRLDDAVRDIFVRAAEREAAQADATRAGIRKMAESLSASAIEKRFGDAVRAYSPKTRRAELWRMFRLMEEDLVQLAELRFRKEVEERMRGPRLASAHENDGFGL